LTDNSLHSYLASDTAVKHLSLIVTKNVLKDRQTILPSLEKLLIDYLDQDFDLVSKRLEEVLINVLWMPDIRQGTYKGINEAG